MSAISQVLGGNAVVMGSPVHNPLSEREEKHFPIEDSVGLAIVISPLTFAQLPLCD